MFVCLQAKATKSRPVYIAFARGKTLEANAAVEPEEEAPKHQALML
jgi:hypothetical protein